MNVKNNNRPTEETAQLPIEDRFSLLEEKINALSRQMTLMLIFVFSVTLALFIFHWAGHALSHPL